MSVRRLLLAMLVVSFCSLSLLAVDKKRNHDARTLEPGVARVRAKKLVPSGLDPLAESAQRFVVTRGGEWRFDADTRTERVTLVEGSGIPIVPGRGNALGQATVESYRGPDGELNVVALEPLVREFIQQQRSLLLPADGRLEFDRETSMTRQDGDLHSFYYRWLIGAVPVEHARVFVRVNHGNITQFGAPLIGHAGVDPNPTIDPAAATRRLLDWSGDEERARLTEAPRLLIQPEEDAGALGYRLVWLVTYRIAGKIETWEGRVDAHSGELVRFRDTNLYGRASGGIYPRTVIDPEIVVPMPFVNISGATTATTDTAGAFSYTGGTIASGLDGPFFTTVCESCTNPSQTAANVFVGSGQIEFGSGGLDAVGNGFSTPAERNAFYHLNQARRVAKKWLVNSWLESNITINVNIEDTCNAVWTGAANFFRSGGGCNNTGEISDVMYHEWGHGLDGNTRGGDGATGEATADVLSIHITHSPLIGPHFRTNGSPVRNIDQFTSSRGLLTVGNITSKCSTLGTLGPLGFEVHCEGEIYGQTAWDLAQDLVASQGLHSGWRTSEQIFFDALPDSGSYLPTGSFPIYSAYVNADDDDGNLANGTPHGAEIFAAFDAHGIAGTAVGASAACVRPNQPSLMATPSCSQIDLSWGAVAGTSGYTVMRSDLIEDRAFYELADVAAGTTTYIDTEVAPGVPYYYVVVAARPDGCESTIENPVAAQLDLQPVLTATALVATDEPMGNRSGFADPGEAVDLILTLKNLGTLDSTTIGGTLNTSTPGATILDDSGGWPLLPVGTSAASNGTFRFETDDQVLACGDTVQFTLAPNDASLCLSDSSFLEITLGDRQVVLQDDFETDQGWRHDALTSTASAGNWILGDPDGTSFQPEDDVSIVGTQAWFTASNGGGLGLDDVDDGVVVLLSPLFDLSGQTEAIFSYYRWWANRDLGEDAGDFFAVDVNDGSGWVNLETLGTNESAATWTRREFALHDLISLTANVRFRVQAADGVATGNLIEAAIDEMRIDRPVCDSTPACFIEPTFAGADLAAAGSNCGQIDLSWQPAISNCTNATLSYNVYRSTTPGFAPGAATLLAAGLPTTSFADAQLAPGVTYHYVVRAQDSRSGEETNAVEVAVPAQTAPDTIAPLFGGLEALSSGDACGETVLNWSMAQESCSGPVAFNVYRASDPAFIPDAASLVGSTLATEFVDAALTPGTAVTYVVRAVDGAGNEDVNDLRLTVGAGILDLSLAVEEFESDDGGWTVVAPNDAVTGNWEWGDPVGDGTNPEDDRTPGAGVNAWVTGLAATAPGGGNNDVDDGTTTLFSANYDLTGAVDPEVRYARWYTNDTGGNPGEDLFTIEVNDGSGWVVLETVGAAPLSWVDVAIPLNGVVTPTAIMRFRFSALDLGVGGSLVEAGIDDFSLVDRDQGCLGCTLPVTAVGSIHVDRSGDDIVLDWSADAVSGTRYIVYQLSGPTFSDAVAIGTSASKSFVHPGAALTGNAFFYRVSAVDACANESALE